MPTTKLIRETGIHPSREPDRIVTRDWLMKDGGTYIVMLEISNPYARPRATKNPEIMRYWRRGFTVIREDYYAY